MAITQNTNCCLSPANPCHQVAPLFLNNAEKIKNFIQKMVQDPEIARDLTQDLYLKIYNNCEQLPQIKNLNAWLYQVSHNAVMDYFRANKKLKVLEQPQPIKAEIESNDTKEILELIEPLIALLPATYAQPLYLSEIKGLPHKEIALQLNLTLSNTKSRIQRGREKLKALFLECCYLEMDRNGKIIMAQPRPNCQPLQQLLP